MKSKRLLRFLLQFALGAAGIAFIVIALRRATKHGWHSVIPSLPRFLIAEALLTIGLIAAGAVWRAVLGPHERPWLVTRGFYISVLAKYVPGGIWQAVGQAGTATQAGIPARRAVSAFPVHALVLAISGAFVGSGIAFTVPGLALGWRLVAALALGSVVLLDRRWIAKVFEIAKRFVRRIPTTDVLPEQSWIVRGFALNIVSVVLNAAAFAILVRGGLPELFAFAAAWTAGFVLLPVPNGLGVREAILLALLNKPAAVVLGASVALRVATMVVELAVAAVTSARATVLERRAAGPKT